MDAHLEVGVGDEGGFAPKVSSNQAPLEFICKGIEKAGLKPGVEVGIALDPASSEFHKDGKYHLHTENCQLSSEEMVAYYEKLVKDFPIGLIEDGLAEDDWGGWTVLNAKLGHRIELVGDDIFCTNPAIIAEGIQKNIANAALIKLNQIGSVSETLQAIKLCDKNG
jgi:enolase